MTAPKERTMTVENFLKKWCPFAQDHVSRARVDIEAMLRVAQAEGMREAADLAIMSRCTMANLYGQMRERADEIEEGRG